MDYLDSYKDFIRKNNLNNIVDKIDIFFKKNEKLILDSYNKSIFPKEILKQLKELRLGSGNIVNNYTKYITDEEFITAVIEISKRDLSLATFFGVQISLVFQTINNLGTKEQKSLYLKKLANYEMIGSFGLTEPNHGSDIIFLETNFKKKDNYYVINGEKRWIGNATFADFILVFCRNEDNPMELGIFIIDRELDGVKVEKIKYKSGLKLVENANIVFENVIVNESKRLKCRSFKDVNKTLMPSRFYVGVSAVGALLGSYEKTFSILKEKQSFFNPLLSYQIQQYKLIDVQMKLDTLLLLILRGFYLIKNDKLNHGKSSFIKALATREAREGIKILREMIGGNGILYDVGIGKMLSDIEILYTYEGTYDINVLIAGKDITGLNVFAKL